MRNHNNAITQSIYLFKKTNIVQNIKSILISMSIVPMSKDQNIKSMQMSKPKYFTCYFVFSGDPYVELKLASY